MEIILTPPVAFLIYLVLAAVLSGLGRMWAFHGEQSAEAVAKVGAAFIEGHVDLPFLWMVVADVTLGRPGALEIRYMASEETVALPIDPARVSNKGEMPYNAVVMGSDSPVAVWVFGTVLNYAIGLPENLVTALQPGDRLRLTTDTGFALPFIVTQTERRASHEAGDLLSEKRRIF